MNKKLVLFLSSVLLSVWICRATEKGSGWLSVKNEDQGQINNHNFYALYKGLQLAAIENFDVNKRTQNIDEEEFYSPDNSDSEEESVIAQQLPCDVQSNTDDLSAALKRVVPSLSDLAKTPCPDIEVMQQEFATLKKWLAESKKGTTYDYARYVSSRALAEKYFKMSNIPLSDSNNMIMKLTKLIACGVISLESKDGQPKLIVYRPHWFEIRSFLRPEQHESKTSDFSVLNKMIEQSVRIDCHVTTIPGAITVLKNLERVEIYGSERISSRICELPQLTNLTIEKSPQAFSPIKDYLTQCTGLTGLNLQTNKLSGIPSGISALTNLAWLCLGMNQLTDIPTEVSALTNLIQFNLIYNQLTDIPTEISVLINLTKLWLGSNKLLGIPAGVIALTSLTELDLRYNQLTSISAGVSALTNITKLWLGNNQLTSIPAGISMLTNLTELDLSWNRLTSIPTEVSMLTNLTKLDLAINDIEVLPRSMIGMTQLKDLLLSYKGTNVSYSVQEWHQKMPDLFSGT